MRRQPQAMLQSQGMAYLCHVAEGERHVAHTGASGCTCYVLLPSSWCTSTSLRGQSLHVSVLPLRQATR